MKKTDKHNMTITRFIPLTIILFSLAGFFYFRLYNYMTFAALKQHRDFLVNWTEKHYMLSSLIYISTYIIAVAASIPGAALLTISGGFLFGPVLGTLFVTTGATLGATLLFLAAKTAFADLFAAKAGPTLQSMKQGFQSNALHYLLFLRLVPLFPFWLVNIVPALLKVRPKTFVIATFFGIIPGSFVYVFIGNGLNAVFAQNKTPNLNIIFTPTILAPLIGLALLSIAPILYKKFKATS